MANENFLINNIQSNYDDEIDSLLFIQDINPSNMNFRNIYNSQYNENIDIAVGLLKNNNYFTPINADLFTAINNRIRSLQSYLTTKADGMIRAEFGDEPMECVEGKIWFQEK